jgi:aminopeptidase N
LHDAFAATRGRPYDAEPSSVQRRRLASVALGFLCAADTRAGEQLAAEQFERADNMTDRQSALARLVEVPGPAREHALEAFHARWKHDPLVLDKWFSVQALSSADDTMDRVLELARHPDFTRRNPNRLRSLVGVFAMRNQLHFHAADGRGYRFLADEVLAIDPANPSIAARLVSAFNQWRRFDGARQSLQRGQLERILGTEGLSRDVHEIVQRALAPSS